MAENGLVAVLSTLDMGMAYHLFRHRDKDFARKKRPLRPARTLRRRAERNPCDRKTCGIEQGTCGRSSRSGRS